MFDSHDEQGTRAEGPGGRAQAVLLSKGAGTGDG